MSAAATPVSWSGEAGARRLYALVREACAECKGLPDRVEAGLRATLEIFAADPALAHQLTVEPYLGAEAGALDAQREWIARFADLLRYAAAEDPRASTEPFFLGPFLIGGVRFQIARLVIAGEASDLLRLLPGTLDALLAYYLEPDEPRLAAPVGRP